LHYFQAEGVRRDSGRPMRNLGLKLDRRSTRTGIVSWPTDRHPTVHILNIRGPPDPSDRHRTDAAKRYPDLILRDHRGTDDQMHLVNSPAPTPEQGRRRPRLRRIQAGVEGVGHTPAPNFPPKGPIRREETSKPHGGCLTSDRAPGGAIHVMRRSRGGYWIPARN
jgi:hypothetical protein